jgi:glycosyltransferase involved in cell wall biosynthesis
VLLLNVSNLPWVDGRSKRNQAIFTQLLRSYDALTAGVFVAPPVIAGERRKWVPARSIAHRTVRIDGKPATIIQPFYGLPDWHLASCRAQWVKHAVQDIEALIAQQPYWLWINSAARFQHALALRLHHRAETRIFDSSDDFTAWERMEYRSALDAVVASCDKLLCVNDHVAQSLAHSDKRVFPNCTDFEGLQSEAHLVLPPWFPKRPGAVYIGFIGGITRQRADWALLMSLFQRFSGWQFIFVGYGEQDFIAELNSFANVVFIPERPFGELASIIRSFDVAIVPHQDNACTRGNDLLKILDYLACGVPVVSTRCSNVEQYGNAVYVADDHGHFARMLELLVSGRLEHDPKAGLNAARLRSWQNRVPTLLPWLIHK